MQNFSQSFNFFASCPRGLEAALADELVQLGGKYVTATDGGVAFAGTWSLMMKANLHSRLASRILWRLDEKAYRNEEDLYRQAMNIDWPELFALHNTFKVNVTAVKSPVRSPEFAGLKIKDAICDRFRRATGERPNVDTQAPDMRVHLYLTDRTATFYLDTSGDALFKRGYRVETGDAPMRENLAAGLLALAGWQSDEAFYDPMCGSGTLLIEAAWKALNIAAGSKRSFAFQQLRNHDDNGWQQIRAEAKAAEKHDPSLNIVGSDVSSTALMAAEANLASAGVADVVKLKQLNFNDAKATADSGVLLCNPPYGIRLEELDRLAEAYPQWGTVLKQRFSGWRAYFFTGDPELARGIRLKASKRTPLFNGAIECRLFEYRMVAGGNRDKPAT
ncbi:Ribosomal RNA large subunit methyltransferase L [Andreprevotia sp. IGB-42]|uniref:THUMP domain-containing class I SAM-dependent RNA methyltransferase n=1 Tax=Andreprevotia sp. IGB-42 TaxID=2497473 RepID=UPI00135A1086|nr:THUMP domain-containing protein [Andreprevotia sp. IGB-42]KAF0811402.1 Ribosomal RNA large subunit methyltransferase L [Andreprevotia sp. IGB-42]